MENKRINKLEWSVEYIDAEQTISAALQDFENGDTYKAYKRLLDHRNIKSVQNRMRCFADNAFDFYSEQIKAE